MTSPNSLQSWFLTLLCVMLLVVRVGGAHLHLCFDGGEPPVSFHLEDSGIHHQDEPGVSAPHQDEEVMLADEAIAKFSKLNIDLPVLLLAALLLWSLFQVSRQPPPAFRPEPVPGSDHRLRPPLRGPPLAISH